MPGTKNPIDNLKSIDSIEDVAGIVQKEADDFLDDVKEEIIEVKDNFIKEIKEAAVGIANSVLGDAGLFWSIIKTIFKWLVNPTALNVRDIEKENLKRAGEGLKARYYTDFNLMKSIFMLSLTFLVVEEVATHASQDHWISQVTFFLFFVVLLFIFLAAMWLWKMLIGIKTKDARVFIGFLIYQYATIYIISFIVYGPLGIETTGDESGNYLFYVYMFPLLQSCYFIIKLMKYYDLSRLRKVIGFILGVAFLVFFLILPIVINETFLATGIGV